MRRRCDMSQTEAGRQDNWLLEKLWSGSPPMEDWTTHVSGGAVHIDAIMMRLARKRNRPRSLRSLIRCKKKSCLQAGSLLSDRFAFMLKIYANAYKNVDLTGPPARSSLDLKLLSRG